MASADTVPLNDPHPPHKNAIEAFQVVEETIKKEIILSRRHWDKHEPRMWERASRLSDDDLTAFEIANDLVQVRSGNSFNADYGTIIFGKIRIPKIKDEQGEGFVHVRIHDPPNRGTKDVMFHAIHTEEGPVDADGKHAYWKAIHTRDDSLQFFNE